MTDHWAPFDAKCVLGVDATKTGWVGVVLGATGAYLDALVRPTIGALVETVEDLAVVAIDVPIGLPDSGRRIADSEARKRVGSRHASVFSSPTRGAMEADTLPTAVVAQLAATGKGLTAQTWGLRAKLIEVDRWVKTGPDVRVVEVHPEVSFAAMNGSPLAASKHSWTGQAERRKLLAAAGITIPTDIGDAGRCSVDDVLDAAAAAWSAHRVRAGAGQRLPDPPEVFADGLDSAIYF
jgi:predicted RNase H-like nuclease